MFVGPQPPPTPRHCVSYRQASAACDEVTHRTPEAPLLLSPCSSSPLGLLPGSAWWLGEGSRSGVRKGVVMFSILTLTFSFTPLPSNALSLCLFLSLHIVLPVLWGHELIFEHTQTHTHIQSDHRTMVKLWPLGDKYPNAYLSMSDVCKKWLSSYLSTLKTTELSSQ